MKILLINLPGESKTRDFTTPDYLLTDFVRYPPLGLLAIATLLERRHNLKVVDVIAQGMSIAQTVDYVLCYKPDLLGITVVTRHLYAMNEITHRVKAAAPEIKIVVGGPHINYFPVETMQLGAVDYCLAGYGEKTFPRLVEALDAKRSDLIKGIPGLHYLPGEGKIAVVPELEEPENLDDLPFPDRGRLNLDDYFTAADKVKMTTMYSSRGCPFRCVFCDVQEKRFQYRSAKKVVDEFQEIINLGIREVFIFDDSFNIVRQRVVDICEEIIRRKMKIHWSSRVRVYPFDRELAALMKKSGCSRLHAGIETLDPELLKYMKKGITLEQIKSFFKICNEFHIATVPYFMFGFPAETREYRESFFDEVKKLKPTYLYINILCPLPKTEYYESLLKDGTYKQDFWADFVRNPKKDYEIPLPRSPELHAEITDLADKCLRRFLLAPSFVLREFMKSLMSPPMLFLKVKIAILLIIKTTFARKKATAF